jgi:hypothetical protein
MEADETFVTRLRERSTLRVPEAPANRPVPHDNVRFHDGRVWERHNSLSCNRREELVAVGRRPYGRSDCRCCCNIDGEIRGQRESTEIGRIARSDQMIHRIVSVAWNVPRNGNSDPPWASVTAAPLVALDATVGAVGASPAHAAAKTQKPSTTCCKCRIDRSFLTRNGKRNAPGTNPEVYCVGRAQWLPQCIPLGGTARAETLAKEQRSTITRTEPPVGRRKSTLCVILCYTQ